MQKVYSILDRVSREYGPLFTCSTDEEAVRTVRQAALYGKSNLSQFPKDFSLYRVGAFNPSAGVLSAVPVPVLVSDVGNIVNVDSDNFVLPQDDVDSSATN